VPDKWPSAKSLFAVNFFFEGSLPRAVLGKAFAEGFWAFAECPGPSAKRAPPVVKRLVAILGRNDSAWRKSSLCVIGLCLYELVF